MKNIFYFLSLACIILFAGCSSDNDEYTEAGMSDSNVACAKLRVGVGLPGADATRAEFQDAITNLVWSPGDKILAVGYDDAGFAIGLQQLTIDESTVGKSEAEFVGNSVEDAVSYRFVYHGKDVHYYIPEEQNEKGMVNCRYLQQLQNASDTNGFDHIKDLLFMCTDMVPASVTGKIQGGILNIQNSILEIDIQNLPMSFDKDGNYTFTYFVNYVEGVIPSAVLTYRGKISSGNYLYMAFDPENDIEEGGKIAFRLSDGTNTLNTSQVSDGKQYEAGMIYTVTIDEGWTWIDERNPSTVEWVDLGLSVKWASHNIGANAPEEYGDYFAWGETTPKSGYYQSNYLNCKPKENGEYSYDDIRDFSGNAKYDAATANWGSPARMPTLNEIEELLYSNKCTRKFTIQNDVKGVLVTGSNGNSIFVPAAGFYEGTSLELEGVCSNFWSSTPELNYGTDGSMPINPYLEQIYSYSFLYDDRDLEFSIWQLRYFGLSVRPVSD